MFFRKNLNTIYKNFLKFIKPKSSVDAESKGQIAYFGMESFIVKEMLDSIASSISEKKDFGLDNEKFE